MVFKEIMPKSPSDLGLHTKSHLAKQQLPLLLLGPHQRKFLLTLSIPLITLTDILKIDIQKTGMIKYTAFDQGNPPRCGKQICSSPIQTTFYEIDDPIRVTPFRGMGRQGDSKVCRGKDPCLQLKIVVSSPPKPNVLPIQIKAVFLLFTLSLVQSSKRLRTNFITLACEGSA